MTTGDFTAILHSGFSSPDAAPTPWADVAAALETADIFWISTVRSDGRPHVTPLPAMWLDGELHFATGLEEQKGRNLIRNPECVLTTGTNTYLGSLDVVVEGRAERCLDRERLERLAQMWLTRLDSQYDVVSDGFRHRRDGAADTGSATVAVFMVRPTKILSFSRIGEFAQTRHLPTAR